MNVKTRIALTMAATATFHAAAADLVPLSVEVDGWTLSIVADAGATTHIIATRDDDEARSTDIDVVLYEREGADWLASAYDPSVTKEDAIIDLAAELGLPDPFGGEWDLTLDTDDVLEHVLPRKPFGSGFFAADPLYAVASQMPNPQPSRKERRRQACPRAAR